MEYADIFVQMDISKPIGKNASPALICASAALMIANVKLALVIGYSKMVSAFVNVDKVLLMSEVFVSHAKVDVNNVFLKILQLVLNALAEGDTLKTENAFGIVVLDSSMIASMVLIPALDALKTVNLVMLDLSAILVKQDTTSLIIMEVIDVLRIAV